ncbi:MAG: hypothetical protein L3J89_13965 [Gammaproteobacteria bacterium]|nr:hypothetical protein [Gammaproteobacteria bacterium]
MYINFEKENKYTFADAELSYLEELLNSIDKIISEITSKIKCSVDPESDGILDKGEYFIGVGFCAMQRYLVDVLQDKKIDKGLALQLGPKNKDGVAISIVVHAAGNYWKHSPEWHIWMDELDDRSQKTVDRLVSHDGHAWYVLSDVLHELCNEKELSLCSCIPHLEKWRFAVHQKLQKNV